MNNFAGCLVFHCAVIAFLNPAIAQIDSLSTRDLVRQDMDQLMEQAAPVEDSPLPDLLSQETERSGSTLSIRSRILQLLQRAAGFTSGAYHGSPVKSYQRIRVNAGEHLSAGILFEKDAGEVRYDDFTAGNITISGAGPVRKLVLGDFLVEAGEGMALWRGVDLSKGADIISPVQRNERGLIQYLSSDEHNYFSGLAAEFETGILATGVFVSSRSLSASIDSNNRVTGFSTSGYFRTDAENKKRDDVQERLFGWRSAVSFAGGQRVGIAAYTTGFSRRIHLQGATRFEGDEYSLAALNYAFKFLSVSAFGEWALGNGAAGGISGFVLQPASIVRVIASLRHYPSNFVSLHGLGFGERFPNEDGLYVGLHMKLSRRMSLDSYYDQYRFPAPVPGMNFPSVGSDLFLRLEILPEPQLKVHIRFQRKVSDGKGENEEGLLPLRSIDEQIVRRLRLDVGYELTHGANVRTKFERVDLGFENSPRNEKGLMMCQEIALTPADRLRLDCSLAFFRSDSYDSRIYATEKDLDGVLAVPALYGRGVRWYILLSYQLSDRCECSAKYSDLLRDDVKRIGTGLDGLPGNHDNRISLQIDLGF